MPIEGCQLACALPNGREAAYDRRASLQLLREKCAAARSFLRFHRYKLRAQLQFPIVLFCVRNAIKIADAGRRCGSCFLAVQLDLEPQVVQRVRVAQRILVRDESGLVGSKSDWSNVTIPSSRDFFMISLMPRHVALEHQVEISGELRHLDRGHAAAAVAPRNQPLRDEGADVERQVHQREARAAPPEEVDDRSSAWFMLLACSVVRHRWPVSENAVWSIVSRSRTSPIRMTSGACARVLQRDLHPSPSRPLRAASGCSSGGRGRIRSDPRSAMMAEAVFVA